MRHVWLLRVGRIIVRNDNVYFYDMLFKLSVYLSSFVSDMDIDVRYCIYKNDFSDKPSLGY